LFVACSTDWGIAFVFAFARSPDTPTLSFPHAGRSSSFTVVSGTAMTVEKAGRRLPRAPISGRENSKETPVATAASVDSFAE